MKIQDTDMKTIKNILLATAALAAVGGMTSSCDDMLDMGNDYVIYTDGRHLTNPADTATSVLGILNKIQGIVVRTNLMGELRADLVTVNDEASSDLKDISNLDIQSGNAYNNIRDYYAVINNCNLFLATADSTAGNANRNEKYFKREIAQVHAMRAWTYLQAAKVYGKVPLVTEPVLTKKDSEADYPMYDLSAVCDYFINDLKPYYAEELPDYGKIGSLGRQEALHAMFPSQVVMGDLYLWKAALNQDKESAKQAAKCYYDYIMFDKNGKQPLTTALNLSYWGDGDIQAGNLMSPYSYGSSGTITSVPMDSAASEGYYNQLRELYNSSSEGTVFQYASITPSAQLKEISEAQVYAGFDSNRQLVYVTRDMLSEYAIRNGYVGDLRFGTGFTSTIMNSANKEYEFQNISKHSSRNYTVYHANQLYLRLAEALNYAGYPRFARQILTMGLSNNVITCEVKPYYTAEADQAFIDYFQFANSTFQPAAENFTPVYDQYGLVNHYAPVARSGWPFGTMGIHMMGSGDAYANTQYAPLAVADSTNFPKDLFAEIPAKPEEPATVAQPSARLLTYDEWEPASGRKTEARYNIYVKAYEDSVAKYTVYLEDMEVYTALKTDYDTKLEAFRTAATEWHAASYGDPAFILAEQQMVDQYILDEQALELCYEGSRYYDLMRRALWWNDNSKLIEPISKRTSNATKLNDRSNWYLKIEE